MNSVKQILMTVDPVGGVWTYAMELARGLASHEVSVAFAVMGAALSEAQRMEVAAIPRARAFESTFQLEWMNNPWKDVELAGQWLLKLEDEVEPDLIHLNGFVHGSLPWRAPSLIVAHSDVLSWFEAVHGGDAPPEWDEYRVRVKVGLHAACSVVAVSQAMADLINRLYGPLDVEVVHNGRDPHMPCALKEHLVLSCGRLWDEAKNVAALNEAAASIEWPVHAAGEGAGHLSNLKLLGKLSPAELASWYAKAAIFALPARYEPFGYSPLEAALAGCALVLGDIPSLREIWGDAALFARPDDPSAIAASVNSLIRDKQLREEYARRARIRASRYRTNRMANDYLATYGRILAGALCEL